MDQAGTVLNQTLQRSGGRTNLQGETTDRSVKTRSPTTIDRQALIARRREVIAKLIDDLYVEKNQEPPERDVLTAMAAKWDRRLTRKRVPTRRLREVYDRAADTYDNRSPFSVFHLTNAWDEICQEEAGTIRQAPAKCDYEHIDEETKRVELVFIGTRREATLPCPVCLPAQFNAARKELFWL